MLIHSHRGSVAPRLLSLPNRLQRVQVIRLRGFLPSSPQSRRCYMAAAASGSSLRDLLENAGGLSEVYVDRIIGIHPEVEQYVSHHTAVAVLEELTGLGLHGSELAKVMIRHPRVLASQRVPEVLAFLRQDLDLGDQELRTLVKRFPQVLSYGVQAHLRPHLAYLSSLGEDDLQGLVLQRPAVLGEGIESIVKFLQLCRLPRKQIYKMLRSYPLDYCLRLKQGSSGASPPDEVEKDNR